MPLVPGTRLGPYEVSAPVGAGGMGEVYRARDTRLGRDVAIKTSKQTFDDRFQREARAIASLNHQNICTLYDVGPDYLVMEYVEGQTLNHRIREGALPETEALAIAMQVANALEAAHDKGIVHRDLKPGNIKIKPDGQVKVLDFGLAKILAGDAAAQNPENSPTMTGMAVTARGVILGTAAYMAPEQARSQAVDKRADIWAFGVVLWEMLTGRRPFVGDTVSDSIAAVLKEEPSWERVSPRVRPLLRRCLEKDPRKRLHDIADARLWLEEAPSGVPAAPVATSKRARITLAAGVACLVGAAGLLYWVWRGQQDVVDDPSIQFALSAPRNTRLSERVPVAISPDGRSIVYGAMSANSESNLYLHILSSGTSRLLAGTAGAEWPMWSPDNQSIAFISGGKLKRMAVAGGPPAEVPNAVAFESSIVWEATGTWGPGFFILRSVDGLVRIPEGGGPPQQLTKLDASQGEISHGFPQVLPDGKHFLFWVDNTDLSRRGVYRGSLEDPNERLPIVMTGRALYAPARDRQPEALVYIREQTLLAQTFDSATGKLSGEPLIITDGVMRTRTMAQFWTSDVGLLVYQSSDAAGQRRLQWRNRQGIVVRELPKADRYLSLFLSPDETQLTVDVVNSEGLYDIYIYNFALGTMSRQTTNPASDFLGVWSPDAQRLVFGSVRSGMSQLYLTRPGGGAAEEQITNGPPRKYPLQWTKDRKYLLFRTVAAHNELWALAIDGDRKPFPVVQNEFSQYTGQISPDGKWIAYQSTEQGPNEVYLQSFPVSTWRVQVSKDGGRWPKWRDDGRELFYVSGNDSMMAVDLTTPAGLQPGISKELFAGYFPNDLTYPYDVTRDGKSFLVLAPVGQQDRPLQVVTHWRSRMKK